jgi:hypothetical protein
MPGGEPFWSLPPAEMAKYEDSWLVSEFVCSEDWKNWEMHPQAEEFVYLLSGDIEFLQELPSGITATRITGPFALEPGACHRPRQRPELLPPRPRRRRHHQGRRHPHPAPLLRHPFAGSRR